MAEVQKSAENSTKTQKSTKVNNKTSKESNPNKDEARLKIINKSKDTVSIKVNGRILKYTWEAFNATYRIVDKIYCVMKESARRELEGINGKIDELVTLCMSGDKSDETSARIGTLSQEIVKATNSSQEDLMSLVNRRITALRKGAEGKKEKSQGTPREKKSKVPPMVPLSATQSLRDVKGADELLKAFGRK